MQAVQYTERTPVYNAKGAVVTSSLIQHTQQPATHPATKQVLLDTREDKLPIAAYHSSHIDKESQHSLQPALTYENKGDERLDTRSAVTAMHKPLPSVPVGAEVMPRAVSETEPAYVTVYDDGAHPFSPRTIGLLGTAARLAPPPAPPAEPITPTTTMQYTETTITTTQVTTQPIQPTDTATTTTQPPAVVAVPSWPPAASEHNLAVAKRVVEASTVRDESPLMAGVEKETPSPLLVSAGPQPYELAHPKNAIDVVQLPPVQPQLPLPAVETSEENAAPLPLAPPTEGTFAVAKRALAARPLPAPVASVKPAAPALPPPTTTTQGPLPVPLLPSTRYEQAQPKAKPVAPPAPAPVPRAVAPATRPAVAPAPRVATVPQRPKKPTRVSDVLLSTYAIALYLLAAALALVWLPFWLIVALAVVLDVAVIAYIKSRPVKQSTQPSQSTALVRYHVPQSAPLPLPAPTVSTAAAVPALLPPQPESLSTALVPVAQPSVPQSHSHSNHARSASRDAATQTEQMGAEEHEEVVPVPKSPAQFFASLRQQHGGSPPASTSPVIERSRHVVLMKKLGPSAKQTQAAQPLLSDAQSIAPAGLHMVDTHDTATATSEVSVVQRTVQVGSSVQSATVPPTPSRLPNPMLDALNSASPRRELKELGEAVVVYNDMQPAAAMPPQVEAAARRAVATIPSTSTGAAVQGAANPSVMVPTWPPQEQQHSVAQARHVVEASTVRDHSVLLDDADSAEVIAQSQPYEVVPPPHGKVVTAPSFHVSPAHAATSVQQRVVQSTTSLPLTTQPLTAEEHAVRAVKQVTASEEKEEVVVADVGEHDRVSDVGAGIVSDTTSGMRLRNVATHDHSQ